MFTGSTRPSPLEGRNRRAGPPKTSISDDGKIGQVELLNRDKHSGTFAGDHAEAAVCDLLLDLLVPRVCYSGVRHDAADEARLTPRISSFRLAIYRVHPMSAEIARDAVQDMIGTRAGRGQLNM